MRRVVDTVGPLPRPSRERSDFADVCRIIVGQQLSLAAAATIWKRVKALEPGWQPENVARISVERLRGAGLSGSKASFVLDAAARVAACEVDLRRVRRMEDAAAAAALRAIRGFGPWSVEMYLIFVLGREDVFSVGDGGLRRAILDLYAIPEADYAARVGRITDRWRPYRSHACRYLWGWLAHPASRT